MKKSRFICRVLCCALAMLFLVLPVAASSTDTDMSIQKGCRTIDGKVSMLKPIEDLAEAGAAFLYDINNDTIIYSANPDVPFAPAGLTKLMTALVIEEKGNMLDQVTVRQEVLDACTGSYGIDFLDGENVSMQDLMYGLLVQGSNAAAIIAVDHVSDSMEAFVQEMNAMAKEIGCTGTNFVDIYGFHHEEQVTTARDMAKILLYAKNYPVAYEAFSTYAHRIPATNLAESRKVSSESFIFNQNLGSNHFDRRVTGSRTGETIDGSRNIVIAATSNDIELISVVLGSTSEVTPDGEHGFYKEIRIMMDKGFNGHRPSQILYENQVIKLFEVKNGDSYLSTGVKDTILTSLPYSVTNSDLNYQYQVKTSALEAPITAGDVVSTVQIWYQDVCIAQADLYALHNVGVKEVIATEEIRQSSGTNAFTVLAIVVVIVGLLVVLMFGRGFIFRVIRKRQIRRQRNNHRRSR